MSDSLLLPPGRMQEITCDSGTVKNFTTGSTLLSTEDGGGLFVVLNDGQKIILGPLKAGQYELPVLCLDSEENLKLEVVPPNPPQGPVQYKAMNSAEMAYPTWLWILLAVVIAVVTAIVFFVRAWKRRKKSGIKAPILKVRKPIEVKMKNFLSEMNAKKIATKADLKSTQRMYSDGVKYLRRLIQKSLGFKAPGATLKEFPVEVKTRLRKSSIQISQQDVARLESLFSQAHSVIYSSQVPAETSRVAYLNNLGEFYKIFADDIAQKANNDATKSKKKFSFGGAKKK